MKQASQAAVPALPFVTRNCGATHIVMSPNAKRRVQVVREEPQQATGDSARIAIF